MFNSSMNLDRHIILGLDGGGTKTNCAVMDSNSKEILGISRAAGSNWQALPPSSLPPLTFQNEPLKMICHLAIWSNVFNHSIHNAEK